MISFQ